MASITVVETRPEGDIADGAAYFESSTNKFIVYDATNASWLAFASDGTGTVPPFNSYSASFDGVDAYLYFGSTAPGTALALGTTDLAISLWFNPANLTSQDFLFRGGNARVFTTASGGLTLKGLDYVSTTISISGALTADTWHHLVVERTSSTQKLYIDNVLQNTQTASGSFTIEQFGYFTSTGYFWEGGIDEISIHSAGLSASDVSAIYNSGSPTDLTGSYNISGWWRMGDDSTGTTVNDLVGSNDLTAANGVNLTSTDAPQ